MALFVTHRHSEEEAEGAAKPSSTWAEKEVPAGNFSEKVQTLLSGAPSPRDRAELRVVCGTSAFQVNVAQKVLETPTIHSP